MTVEKTTTFLGSALRVIDCIVALTGISLTLPIMVLIGLIIKIDSPGPAIFKQRRIGQNRRPNSQSTSISCGLPFEDRRKQDLGGRPFTFYKFRTMLVDAKKRFPELYRYQYTPEDLNFLFFKVPDDPRLTHFGKRLRKTTLDELPNFINLLKGDMSLVGPRPDIPEMIPYYEEWQRKKFQVKPGLTGLAQVNGRGLLSFRETVRTDVEYVDRKSFWFDLKIILKTIEVTFFRIGAF